MSFDPNRLIIPAAATAIALGTVACGSHSAEQTAANHSPGATAPAAVPEHGPFIASADGAPHPQLANFHNQPYRNTPLYGTWSERQGSPTDITVNVNTPRPIRLRFTDIGCRDRLVTGRVTGHIGRRQEAGRVLLERRFGRLAWPVCDGNNLKPTVEGGDLGIAMLSAIRSSDLWLANPSLPRGGQPRT